MPATSAARNARIALAGSLLLGTLACSGSSDLPTGPALVVRTDNPTASAQADAQGNEITVAPSTWVMHAGESVQITAKITNKSGKENPGRPVTFTSRNTAVATVSSTGLVTAVGAGTAEIVAATNGAKPLEASAQIFVASSDGPHITIVSPSPDATVGPGGLIVLWTTDDPSASYECTLDGSAILCQAGVGVALDALTNGVHTVTISGTDFFGVRYTAIVVFRVDATGPEWLSTPAPASPVGRTSTPETEFHFEAFDAVSGEAVTYLCSLDGGALEDCTNSGGGGGVFRWSSLSVGLHSLEIFAIDTLGNYGSTVTVAFTVVSPE